MATAVSGVALLLPSTVAFVSRVHTKNVHRAADSTGLHSGSNTHTSDKSERYYPF